jgi:hypothetical protein
MLSELSTIELYPMHFVQCVVFSKIYAHLGTFTVSATRKRHIHMHGLLGMTQLTQIALNAS